MKKILRSGARGMTLVEVVIATALIVLIFTILATSFLSLMTIITNTRAQTSASALATGQIELLRSLPYDEVGTISGIPSGAIPQNQTLILNGMAFNRRTLIQYVDATQDGVGTADTNGIVADYKRAKVELTWTVKGQAKSFALVTNIVPRGIETIAGGGTLVVNVFDAAVAPVSGASVRIVNASTSPSIDVTAYTDAAGTVMFPGAPASAGYQITANKTGYSTAGTYSASSSNPNPTPAHVAVIASQVSTMNFAIDRTSALTLVTSGAPTIGTFTDTFTDTSQLSSLTNVVVSAGTLSLSGGPGTYALSGNAYATATNPGPIASWGVARWSNTVPANTAALYKMYSVDVLGNRTLIPDVNLAGNSAGFQTSPIILTGLSTSTYPRLALGVTLTSNGVSTPTVTDWEIEHTVSYPVLSNITINISGSKTIGTDGGGVPIKKYTNTIDTNASGIYQIPSLEWDAYAISIDPSEGLDISEACNWVPLTLSPNVSVTARLTLVASTAYTLRVRVINAAGNPIADASVQLTRSGYNVTRRASACGQTFYNGLSSANDYVLDVSALGYTSKNITDITVTGDAVYTVTMIP